MTVDAPLTRAQAISGAGWAAVGALGRYLLAGITTLALTHLLTPGEFGLIAITTIAQALIEHVIPVGFHDALIQRARLEAGDLDAAFWSVIVVSGGALLIVIALAPLAAEGFDQPLLAPLLIGMALAALVRAISTVPRALLNRRMDFRTLTLARLVGMGIGGSGAVALALAGGGAWSLVTQITAVNLAGTGLIWRAAGWRPGRTIPRPALRWLWSFAPSVSLFTILSYVISNADDQLVGYRLGPEALGFYALAYSFMAWPVRDVLGGVAGVLYPVFARFQDDPARLRAAYLESVQLGTLFAFPVLALLTITAPVLIPWLLGARWTPVVLPMQILALGGLREAAVMFNGPVYRALGKPHLHLLLEVCSVPCYVVAFVIGLDFGIAGVALFYVITGVLLQPASWWLVLGLLGMPLRDWLRALIPAAVGTAGASWAAALILHAARYKWGAGDLGALVLAGVIMESIFTLVVSFFAPPALRRTMLAAQGIIRAKFTELRSS
jgi:O-antigen/teichoic acid export membrane protein